VFPFNIAAMHFECLCFVISQRLIHVRVGITLPQEDRVAQTHWKPQVAGNFCKSRKRATNYRALLQTMIYEDRASYGSLPPWTNLCSRLLWNYICIDGIIYVYMFKVSKQQFATILWETTASAHSHKRNNFCSGQQLLCSRYRALESTRIWTVYSRPSIKGRVLSYFLEL